MQEDMDDSTGHLQSSIDHDILNHHEVTHSDQLVEAVARTEPTNAVYESKYDSTDSNLAVTSNTPDVSDPVDSGSSSDLPALVHRTRLERFSSVPAVPSSSSSSAAGVDRRSEYFPTGLSVSAPNSPPILSSPLAATSGVTPSNSIPTLSSNSNPSSHSHLLAPHPIESPVLFDVVIVGAGLSGLTAATHIVETFEREIGSPASSSTPLNILVLESSNRVGGRTLTRHVSITHNDGGADHVGSSVSNVQIDLGGSWVAPTHTALRQLARQWECTLVPQYHKGTKLIQDTGGEVHTYEGELPSHMSWWQLIRMHKVITKIDQLAARLKGASANIPSDLLALDRTTVDSWGESEIGSSTVRFLLRATVRGLLGVEACQVSMFRLVHYVATNGGSLAHLVRCGSQGHQADVFSSGSQRLSEKMALAFGFGRYAPIGLKLGETCRSIRIERYDEAELESCADEDRSMNVIALECRSGLTVFARHVILAAPPTAIERIDFEPRLPLARETLMQHSFMGRITKGVLMYSEAWWREMGYSGEGLNVDDNEDGPIFQLFDGSKMVARLRSSNHEQGENNGVSSSSEMLQPCLIFFINGHASLKWSQCSHDELQTAILDQLCRWYPDIHPSHIRTPLFFDAHDWSHGGAVIDDNGDANSACLGGGPVCSFGPGVSYLMPSAYSTLRQPLGPIHFAGTETADEGAGFMEGAVKAGQRAAEEVVKQIKRERYGNDDMLDDKVEDKHQTAVDEDECSASSSSTTSFIFQLIFFLLLICLIPFLLLHFNHDPRLKSAAPPFILHTYQQYARPMLLHSEAATAQLQRHLTRIWHESDAPVYVEMMFDQILQLMKPDQAQRHTTTKASTCKNHY